MASEDSPPCIIVVPCYNEGTRLKSDVFLDFARNNETVEFLFVNDGSRDNTLAVLGTLAAQCPERIRVLDVQPNAGKAEAVRVGMLAAMQSNATYVGFWDADLATPLDAIPEFLALLDGKPWLQMVFGSRVRLLGRHVHRRAARHYLGRVFASVVSTALRVAIYDTQCGAKIFRATAELRQVLGEVFLSRWVFDVEILARFIALHRGNSGYLVESIHEVPLMSWEDVAGSKVQPGDFFKAFWDIVRIYRRYLVPPLPNHRDNFVIEQVAVEAPAGDSGFLKP